MTFKVLVLGIDMFLAIKWHDDPWKKREWPAARHLELGAAVMENASQALTSRQSCAQPER